LGLDVIIKKANVKLEEIISGFMAFCSLAILSAKTFIRITYEVKAGASVFGLFLNRFLTGNVIYHRHFGCQMK